LLPHVGITTLHKSACQMLKKTVVFFLLYVLGWYIANYT